MKNKILRSIVIFAGLGIAFASYATYAHFSDSATTICTINETFNCDVVNKSSYAEIFGIPVSIFGLIAYIFFIASAVYLCRAKNIKEKIKSLLMHLMVFGSVFGVLFSLYLTGIEAFVLHSWCVMCIGSQISILAIMILVFILQKIEKVK